MTAIWPLVSSTTSHWLNWSLSDAWLLIITGAAQVAPPSVERANQMRVLQVEAALVPGSLAAVVQPVAPVRSVQAA